MGIPLLEKFIGFLVYWFQSFLVVGFLVFGFCFCLVSWLHGFLVSWFRGFLVSNIQSFEVPKKVFKVPKIHKFHAMFSEKLLYRITKCPFNIFWKSLIPSARVSRHVKTDQRNFRHPPFPKKSKCPHSYFLIFI